MRGKGFIFVLVFSLAINASILGGMAYYYYRDASLAKEAPCPLSPAHQHLYQQLGLSASQLAKMDAMARRFHGRLAELEAAMKGKNERLVGLLEQKDVDLGQVEQLQKEIAAIQAIIQKEIIAHILDTKQVLNSKQQKQFFALLNQRNQNIAAGEIKSLNKARGE